MSLIPAQFPHRLLVAALMLAAGTAFARPPVAAPDNLLDDSFTLQAGIGLTSNSTQFRYDSVSGVAGTVIDAEHDAGVPSLKLMGRAELMLRAHDRHRIRLTDSYLPVDRRGTAVLQAPVRFGEPPPFATGATIDTKLNVSMLALTYEYSFVKTKRVEIAAGLGVEVFGTEAVIARRAPVRTVRSEGSRPTPIAGLESTVRLNSRFYFESRAQYIKATLGRGYGRGSVRVAAVDADLLYRLMPNVTLGIGYTHLNVVVDAPELGIGAGLALVSRGPQLFARVGF